MRRFEHPSGKFWSIARHGFRLAVRWGPMGTTGQGLERDFADAGLAEARELADITRQLKLGYAEVEPVEVVPPPPEDRWERRLENETQYMGLVRTGSLVVTTRGWIHDNPEVATERFEHADVQRAEATVSRLLEAANREKFRVGGHVASDEDLDEPEVSEQELEPPAPQNPTLEAACRAAPDDPATWSVYADWLLEQGDPRGEIAAMFQRDPVSWKSKDLVRKHRLALFRSDELGRCCTITTWRHGFPIAISIAHPEGGKPSLAEKTRLILGRPFLQFVEDVRLGVASVELEDNAEANEADADWATTMLAVTSSPVASTIRALRWGDSDHELVGAAFGDFSAAWPKLPALEELVINSGFGGELGTIVLPRLRKLVRISGGLRAEELRSIREATWPALEHLEIWFGTENQGAQGSVAAVADILTGARTPELRHLGLVNCEFIDELILALVASPLLPRLRSLDLSRSTLATAATLVARGRAFEHLDVLDLRRNFLTPTIGDEIRAVLPNADVSDQRDAREHFADVGE